MATPTPKETLDKLFPVPVSSENEDQPVLLPGMLPSAGDKVIELLKDNHDRHHIFFNERGFHNHASHHLLAIYAMGAPASVLDAAYETHKGYQRPAFDPPGDITESNWRDHVGDERYYRGYLRFFTERVFAEGQDKILEKYIFSPSANFVDGVADDKQPRMLNRLFSGVLHPEIHLGHGIEFDSPGMFVEGLSMTAVTRASLDAFVTKNLIGGGLVTSTLAHLTSALSLSSAKKGAHSFDIIVRMLKDPNLDPGAACTPYLGKNQTAVEHAESSGVLPLGEVLEKRGELIRKYAEDWHFDPHNKEEAELKFQEMAFLGTVLYAICGLRPGEPFMADFFLMHLVTSSHWLDAILKHLKPEFQTSFIRLYFMCCLVIWVARGRPALDIEHFYKQTSTTFVPPAPMPKPNPDALQCGDETLAPNAWFPILQSTLVHRNEHLPKIQRTLAHYSRKYGTTPRNAAWIHGATELPGMKLLDGTVFMRAAVLTMNRVGWTREGQSAEYWDFHGFWN